MDMRPTLTIDRRKANNGEEIPVVKISSLTDKLTSRYKFKLATIVRFTVYRK